MFLSMTYLTNLHLFRLLIEQRLSSCLGIDHCFGWDGTSLLLELGAIVLDLEMAVDYSDFTEQGRWRGLFVSICLQ